MWKIIVANESDDDFLNDLNNTTLEEIITHFKEVINVFSNLHSSVYCTSGIFPVESYDATNEKLSIRYHVDNDEEAMRIITVDFTATLIG